MFSLAEFFSLGCALQQKKELVLGEKFRVVEKIKQLKLKKKPITSTTYGRMAPEKSCPLYRRVRLSSISYSPEEDRC